MRKMFYIYIPVCHKILFISKCSLLHWSVALPYPIFRRFIETSITKR